MRLTFSLLLVLLTAVLGHTSGPMVSTQTANSISQYYPYSSSNRYLPPTPQNVSACLSSLDSESKKLISWWDCWQTSKTIVNAYEVDLPLCTFPNLIFDRVIRFLNVRC